MAAAIITTPLVIERGVPLSRTVTLTQNKLPFNLTGLAITFDLHRGTIRLPGTLLLAIPGVIANATGGVASFGLSAAQTASILPGDYVQSCIVRGAGGVVIAMPFLRAVRVDAAPGAT